MRRQTCGCGLLVCWINSSKSRICRIPVPTGHEALLLCPTHGLGQKSTTCKRIHTNAAFPIAHLTAFERVVVRPRNALSIDWSSVVSMKNNQRVVPKALGMQQSGHIPDGFIHKIHHGMVELPVGL